MVSKYDALVDTTKQAIQLENMGTADVVKQKQLEAKLKRIDGEYQQRVDEVRNSPVNSKLQLQQAKAMLESSKKENARQKAVTIQEAEYSIKQAELDVQRKKNELASIQDIASEREERRNLEATQEYERLVAAAGNVDQTIQLRIDRINQERDSEKRDIEIELSNIQIMNEAQAKKVQRIDTLYKDLKEISLALGDVTK